MYELRELAGLPISTIQNTRRTNVFRVVESRQEMLIAELRALYLFRKGKLYRFKVKGKSY